MLNNLLATRSHADIVHTAIPYSILEKYILTTPPLLRLQRISQNSLVYLTFASNKVKRFEHSLGVMHLAGKLFQSAASNTNDEVLKGMLSLFEKELNDWISDRKVKKEKELIYENKIFDNDKKKYLLINKMAPFVGLYNIHTPPHIPKEWSMLYASLYQGVRIAGLLHDVGHLPYSHTIEEVLEILRRKWENNTAKNMIQKEYLEIINSYKGKYNTNKLHEAITIELFPIIETECIRLIINEMTLLPKNEVSDSNKDDYLVFCLYSFEIARRILGTEDNSKSMIYQVLHCIISGTLDVDRLDYTSRDLLCSAIGRDVINYERMFMFLSFVRNDFDNCNENPYPIIIEPKTVCDVEDYLKKRWKSYRDINNHHSVHRSELLMRSIFINSAEKTQNEINILEYGKMKEGYQDLPDNFILGIMYVLKNLKENVDEMKIAEAFLRLDDSWLDTLIKKSTNRNDMVDELAYGRKNYLTIIKRFDDFIEIDEKIYNHFVGNIQFSQLSDDLDNALCSCCNNDLEKYEHRVDYLQYIFSPECFKDEHKTYVFSDRTFWVNRVLNLLNSYLLFNEDIFGTGEYPYSDKFFIKLTTKLEEKYPDNEDGPSVMVGSLWFKDGINDYDCIISGKMGFTPFRTYSGLKVLFQFERMMLPPFHFYCKNTMNIKKTINILTQIVFEILKSDIIAYATELLNEMKECITKEAD